jgi:5'-deoxynucleotidase YfbR-like HD superfamily hydrolase
MNDYKSIEVDINFPIYDPELEQKSGNGINAWIQTFSGRKFHPLNPVIDAIVIQDIAHALSNQCRFSGHVKEFYSVAQHCVLVSYICDSHNALWGLLHDASEAYLVDVPRPVKRSGKFSAYLEFEKTMQDAICKRFDLHPEEPIDVKLADVKLLATEARDLMSPLHPEWKSPINPLPFRIDPLPPKEAKKLFLERFDELFSARGK